MRRGEPGSRRSPRARARSTASQAAGPPIYQAWPRHPAARIAVPVAT